MKTKPDRRTFILGSSAAAFAVTGVLENFYYRDLGRVGRAAITVDFEYEEGRM